MATVNLTSALTLNPATATTLLLEHTHIEHEANAVTITVALRDGSGNLLERRTITATSAQITTWIRNQETTILNALLTRMGITGTVVP